MGQLTVDSGKEQGREKSVLSRHIFMLNDPVQKRFDERNKHLKYECSRLKNYYVAQNSEAAVKEHLVLNRKNKIVYCAIEKIGCTFWKRIFQILSGWRNVTNPFSIRGIQAYEGFSTAKRLPFDKIYQLLRMSTKFMFVREPFERLLSGYVDKIYSPNTAYWNFIGKYIVKSFRENPTNVSLECGHDVTFPEFVEYFVYSQNSNERRDAHFVPSFEHCRPCEIDYDYIGKLETFQEDTFHILKKLDLEDMIKFSDFQNETETDALVDTVDYVFSMKRAIVNCMPFTKGLYRAWRKLQIRGILSKHVKFPYPTDRDVDVTPGQFKDALFAAHAQSGDKESRKKNREEAMLEAYSTVSPILMERLRDALLIDSSLFGYEKIPKKLLELKYTVPDNGGFRYFDIS
uniref:Carbohydrate sulfotransferase n=2 Tax=Magallana TaxID=2171616 RepID=A0A8W8IVY5_MAGGI